VKDATEWDESDIGALVQNKVQESLRLDYKKSDALGRADWKKSELSKDVSAFANSAGGVILYGMEEDKHYPTKHDGGFDPEDISKEWIEQVINSSVHPKIDGLRINQISLRQSSTGRVLYAISIPAAASRAPHQADDKRYYKRYNFQSVPMEDYEIRDIYRRASTPDLWIDFSFNTGKTTEVRFRPSMAVSDPIWLQARIGNRSGEPALYAAIQIYLDQNSTIKTEASGFQRGGPATTEDRRHLHSFLKRWSIQQNDLPIFSEIRLLVADSPFTFTLDENSTRWLDFYIGYDIRAPGCSIFQIVRVIQQPHGTLWITDRNVSTVLTPTQP
jgi:hypothetical protein